MGTQASTAMKQYVETITDLLLGAAYADKRLEGSELETIRTLLGKLLHVSDLPAPLESRLRSFNPAKLDLEVAGTKLAALTFEEKRSLLDLVGSVNEADEVIDMDEDAYLGKVASALGMSGEEVESLELEILGDDDLESFLD